MKLLMVFVLAAMISCKTEDALENEIAQINTDIKVERFDRLFAKVTPEGLENLKSDYPFMFSNRYPDEFWIEKKSDSLQIELFNEVHKSFASFETSEFEIESLFNHLKYYFPEFKTPRLITVTNDVDYRNRVIVTDTIAVIALDAYLGTDHKFYGSIPTYLRKSLNPEQIVVDLADAYSEKYIYQAKRKSLLDEMIFFGKQLYFKDAVVPFKSEAERIGYSQVQLDWAKTNESYIWRYFVERELLYSTDSKLPTRFINPAPFSKFYLEDIDANSPGRVGQYIGWQIVRAYMENNEVTLRDMLIKNSEDIFNNSKFKPKK
ncbi:gliding motility lipoprotein GldB [Tamlana agarivorans]|uniref:Gliding motility lipoprotein GldB n=2 Tax=Pseudotamlana agarivorans TaxID=481183 RepID=A0ACC5U490_9FLAO|nr:gliding motility lipoprotein GldB [Tamlana agarivorans]